MQNEPRSIDEAADSSIEQNDFITMSQIGAWIAAANANRPSLSFAASSSSELPTAIGGADLSGMPLLHDESDLPGPGAVWSPEAMLTFVYSRCQIRFAAAETETKRHLYQERMQVLRDVMAACRSGDASTRMAPAEMTRSMSDLSDDEDSLSSHLSWAGFCNTMDEIERAGEVGQQIAALAHGPLEPATTSCCVHVYNVANALLRSLDDARDVEGAEEEEASDSDECMETNSQRLVRYQNSRMCEVSDIDEWMELHHSQKTREPFAHGLL